MTEEEKLNTLLEWKSKALEIEKQLNTLESVTGFIGDGPLYKTVWDLFATYTKTLATLLDDHSDWLEWYWLECDMGRSPKEAWVNRRYVLVDSLDALLLVMDRNSYEQDELDL